MISPKSGHGDEVTRLNVTILDSVIEGKVLNIRYIILHHMLSILKISNCSLSFSSIITRILKHFYIPLDEPKTLGTKGLSDEAISNLRFIWEEDQWAKDCRYKDKVTYMALTDDHICNDILSPGKLHLQ